MQIAFREIDPFNVWIWLDFGSFPSELEKQYIEEVFSSWYFIGKLGGFNAENLQVQDAGIELSYLEYDLDQADKSFLAPMHNMGEIEYHQTWARCWFDLGTSDAIALDVLINALRRFSEDYVSLRQLIIGGENQDWPAPDNLYHSDVSLDS